MSMINAHPMPPPTTNALDATSRTRLIKSTRKLGAVLGTTPLVVETAPTAVGPAALALKLTPSRASTAAAAAKRQRRQGSIFELPPWEDAPPRSSLDSVASTASSATGAASHPGSSLVHLPLADAHSSCTSASESEGDAPRPRGLAALRARASTKRAAPAPLHLHLFHQAPAGASLDDDAVSYPREPHTALPATPDMPTPLTPRTSRAAADSSNGRVRRMAKIQRTLGEPVPPELIYAGPPRREEEGNAPAASRRAAEPTRPLRIHPRRGTVTGLAPTTTFAPPAVPPLPAASDAAAARAARRRSASFSSAANASSARAQMGATDAAVAASRYAPIQHVTGGARAYPTVVCAPLAPPRKGQEGGWFGEWNRGDMREVRDGLRALRAR